MSTTRTSDDRLDAALRSVDAAPPSVLDDVARVRADAAMERLLAEGRDARGRSVRRDPLVPRPRRTGLRVAALGAAAAAAVVGVGATQVLGGATTAYAATWVEAPTAASPADVAAAEEACDSTATSVAGDRADELQVRLAERRGDLVLLALDDGAAQSASLMCVVGLPPGGDAEFLSGSGGSGAVTPAPDGVTDAGIFERSTPGDELSVIDGLAGDRVRAVTVHTAAGRVVEATVQGGHYAAWWPGRAMTTSSAPLPEGTTMQCAGDCDGGQPVPDYTLDITLDDGTVLHDVVASAG